MSATTPDPEAAGDFTAAPEPFRLFEEWYAQASKSEPNDPNAMAIATSDANGLPNVRMVLLKGLDEAGVAGRGFVFYTNLGSAKGQELASNPQAAILFHWKSLLRQVRVRGLITPVSSAEADAYYDSRPRMSRIGAWASDQSRALDSRLTSRWSEKCVSARSIVTSSTSPVAGLVRKSHAPARIAAIAVSRRP